MLMNIIKVYFKELKSNVELYIQMKWSSTDAPEYSLSNLILMVRFCLGRFKHGGCIMQTSVEKSKDNLVSALCFIYLSDMSVWIHILQAVHLK